MDSAYSKMSRDIGETQPIDPEIRLRSQNIERSRRMLSFSHSVCLRVCHHFISGPMPKHTLFNFLFTLTFKQAVPASIYRAGKRTKEQKSLLYSIHPSFERHQWLTATSCHAIPSWELLKYPFRERYWLDADELDWMIKMTGSLFTPHSRSTNSTGPYFIYHPNPRLVDTTKPVRLRAVFFIFPLLYLSLFLQSFTHSILDMMNLRFDLQSWWRIICICSFDEFIYACAFPQLDWSLGPWRLAFSLGTWSRVLMLLFTSEKLS